MKKTDSDSSTVDRLERQQVKRIRRALFFSWLFAVLLLIICFCYINDSSFTGEVNPLRLLSGVTRKLEFYGQGLWMLPGLRYIITTGDNIVRIVDATLVFYVSIAGFILLSLFQSLVVLFSRIMARAQIRKQLQPLYELVKAADRLSRENSMDTAAQMAQQSGHYEDSRIHDLENAIENMPADAPNSMLHTEDKDLKGLEDAINGLLERTRAGYSQQIRFVSDASHELRTPIAVLKGYADMLDRWGKSDEKILDESITAIRTETEHMNRLVEQLLFLARGDSGRTKLSFEPFSLSDMVHEVYDESVMIDSTHHWELISAEPITINGDQAMLKQATRILVDNALKYTPKGNTIKLKASYDEKNIPTITVQDSGIGISGQDMSHIFDRFYRSDPARGRQQGGTGLGLAIAKWIVDRHGGYFQVLSREDVGTRISICLPQNTQ